MLAKFIAQLILHFFVVLSHHVVNCVFGLYRPVLDPEKKAYVFYGPIHGAHHCANTLLELNKQYMNEGTEHKVLPHKLSLWQWTQRERPSSPSPSTLPSPLPPAHHLHLLEEQRPRAHSFRQAHRGPKACLCVSRSSVPPKGWKGPASQGPWLFNVLSPTSTPSQFKNKTKQLLV